MNVRSKLADADERPAKRGAADDAATDDAEATADLGSDDSSSSGGGDDDLDALLASLGGSDDSAVWSRAAISSSKVTPGTG